MYAANNIIVAFDQLVDNRRVLHQMERWGRKKRKDKEHAGINSKKNLTSTLFYCTKNYNINPRIFPHQALPSVVPLDTPIPSSSLSIIAL